MNTCGTCKHWRPYERLGDDPGYAPGFGTCGAVQMHPVREATDSWLACVVDASDYFAALRTRDSFGCILWEAKA